MEIKILKEYLSQAIGNRAPIISVLLHATQQAAQIYDTNFVDHSPSSVVKAYRLDQTFRLAYEVAAIVERNIGASEMLFVANSAVSITPYNSCTNTPQPFCHYISPVMWANNGHDNMVTLYLPPCNDFEWEMFRRIVVGCTKGVNFSIEINSVY